MRRSRQPPTFLFAVTVRDSLAPCFVGAQSPAAAAQLCVKRQWTRDDFMGGMSNPAVMRRITHALVLAVFAGNCLVAWAMQKSILEIRHAFRVLPYFANLCIDLRASFVLLPIVAALCYLWLWFRKGENAPGWRGLVIVTMTVLILFVLPAIGSSYLLMRDLVRLGLAS